MKVFVSVALCMVIFLSGFFCGRFISNSSTTNSSTTDTLNDIAGTYKTSTWNGGDAVLVLYDNGECIHPSGAKGTWSVEEMTIHLDVVFHLEDGVERIDAQIVPNGIMLHSHFFEKL